jgi:membrane associated rhomboid family serine protease
VRTPVTAALIAACALVFAYETTLEAEALEDLVTGWGATPAYLLHDHTPRELATLVTSLFIHSGWVHFLVNMAFLLFVGARVERALGSARFLALFFACGAIVTLTRAAFEAGSVVPIIGVSGAVAGVLGGWLAGLCYSTGRWLNPASRATSLPTVSP